MFPVGTAVQYRRVLPDDKIDVNSLYGAGLVQSVETKDNISTYVIKVGIGTDVTINSREYEIAKYGTWWTDN